MYRLYRPGFGPEALLKHGAEWRFAALEFDDVFTADDRGALLDQAWEKGRPAGAPIAADELLAPIGSQEIWAAGVTYYRSRTARMEESEATGGDRFYDMVYEAERPELFFKASAHRARGHRQSIGVRSDSDWDVPEPELTLAIDPRGEVFGYTIGNDVSSRAIEGANPLYLPQAKVYDGSCALGPCLVIGAAPHAEDRITLRIRRGKDQIFEGETDISQIKRSFEELAGFLFKDNTFPAGTYLMTGTGVVPDPPFTLSQGDIVSITIDGIGTLSNPVVPASQVR